MKKILVIGSSNTDLISQVDNFPKAGETIKGVSFSQAMGGKGANQALAAHKLGGDVKFITSLGKDANGQNSLVYYKKEGLDISSSLIVDDAPSGTAIILVDKKGENCIVINSGANERLSPEYVREVQKEIADTDIVVLQMEIPYETVKVVCELASKHKKIIILNVAPACKLDSDLISMLDILIVNEIEAETISGKKIDLVGKEAVVDSLLAMGATTVILTLGKDGCMLKDATTEIAMDAFDVEAIDTTAAGDVFCGALSACLGKGEKWEDSLRFASAASAISVTRLGAQPSVPTENEVLAFLKEQLINS
jgi:ribokinase